MARSLNKKYFGNRNVGADDTLTTGEVLTAGAEIGGEGIASINWASLGTFRTTPVGLALPAPTIAGGVQAVWSAITYRVNGVVTSAGKTNLAVGWKGTSSFFPGMIAVVTSVSGSNAVFSILSSDGGSAGSDLSSVPNSGNTNTITLTKSAGGGTAGTFTVDVNLQIVPMTIVTQGSGYTGSETFTVTVAGGMDPPAGTIVLTTDTGSVGSVTNRENAIVAYAYIGSSLVEVDIQRQVSSKRYRVNKSGDTSREGARIARIRYDAVADGTKGYTASEGVELNIVAIDSDGGTYLVRKLTNHNAVVVPMAISRLSSSAGVQFPATTDAYGIVRHKSVPWTFNGTTAPKVLNERPLLQSGVNVKLENA